MALANWLRFAELALLTGWLIGLLYRRPMPSRPAGGRRGRSDGPEACFDWALPVIVALLAIAQLVAQAQAETGPLAPVEKVLPLLLPTAYGVLSLLVVLTCALLALLAWAAGRMVKAESLPFNLVVAACVAIVLLLCAGTSLTAQSATAEAAAGQIAMSYTLAVPRSSLALRNPYAGDPDSLARGEQVYQQNCAVCHGLGGNGDGPAARGMRIRPPSFRGNPQHYLAPGMDGAHFWVVQHGDGRPDGMPAWQGRLSEQQMWDAVNYIKSLAAAPVGAPPGGSPGFRGASPAGVSAGSSAAAAETTPEATVTATPTPSCPATPGARPGVAAGPASDQSITSPVAAVDGMCLTLSIDPGRLGPQVGQGQTVTLATAAGAIDDAQLPGAALSGPVTFIDSAGT